MIRIVILAVALFAGTVHAMPPKEAQPQAASPKQKASEPVSVAEAPKPVGTPAPQQETPQIAPKQPEITYAVGVEQWRGLVSAYFGSETDYALRIMRCESGGNPRAVSHTNDHGLFQINYPSHYNKVASIADLYVPEVNVRVAKQIRNGSGWGAWVCSRKI